MLSRLLLLAFLALLPVEGQAAATAFYGSNTSPGRLVSSIGGVSDLTIVGAPVWSASTPPEGDHWLALTTTTSDYYTYPADAMVPSGAGTTGSIWFYFIPNNNGMNQQMFLFSNGGSKYCSAFVGIGGTSLTLQATTTVGAKNINATGLTTGQLYSAGIVWDAAGTSNTVYSEPGHTPVSFASDAGVLDFTGADQTHSAIGVNNYGAATWTLTNSSMDAFQISTDPNEPFPPADEAVSPGGAISPYQMQRTGVMVTPLWWQR